MKKLLLPTLLVACILLVACNEKKSRRTTSTDTIVAKTLDAYAGVEGGIVKNCYADSTPRDIYFYRIDSAGNLTDEVVQEVHCYENSNIYMEGAVNHNQRNGVWNAYHKNGRLQATCTYQNGVQVGDEKVYYENGNLLYSGQYNNGTCVGTWRFFSESGVKTQELEATDSTIVCRTCDKCQALIQLENQKNKRK